MSGIWDVYNERPAKVAPREYLVSVEVYISNAAGAHLRKPASDRKKADKRGSAGDDFKLREKSSLNWISQHKGLSSAGHWRPAKCKLMEEGERCLLNVYVDESILYQTIFIHLLNSTDIRQTDNSIFYRKDCLGVYAISNQRWTPSNTIEPLYLQFSNTDMCYTWLALLRSYAIPEIYGRWFYALEGGSYRMWRQVELTIIQGRQLGQSRYSLDGHHDKDDSENADADISCEVHLNNALSSRTTVKKGLSSPDWHESFTFTDLPPFDQLEIVVWKEKKLFKPVVIGRTRVNIGNFRRGDTVEGWYPVVLPGHCGSEIQAGELRLKIRVDEEIILPSECYVKLMNTCSSRSFLDWMSDLETRLKLKTISSHLMAVAVATDVAIDQIQKYATREVGNANTSQQTLFRGNTTLTKTVELCMTWYGRSFLEASIGTVLRKLIAEKVAIEVDPMRLTGKSNREVERNVDALLSWCQQFWDQIYSVRMECPNELRMIFQTLRKLVEQRYKPEPPPKDSDTPPPNNLRWQSVSAFCFLRFIVPAILHPHLFGLTAGLPSPAVQRSLTLIAKVIQSLANLNSNLQKETYMKGVQTFIKDRVSAMIDYIAIVSTPKTDGLSSSSQLSNMERHERLHIVNSLHVRKKEMTSLDRECIPNLPHLLDVPKHLAIITSAVIRSSRELSSLPRTGDDTDLHVDEFCSRCFEVEEEALERVSQLATKLELDDGSRLRTHAASDPGHESVSSFSTSQLSTATSSTYVSNRQRTMSRPTTAPGPSSPVRPTYSPTVLAVTSPRAFATILPENQRSYNYSTRPSHLPPQSTSVHGYVHPTQPELDDPARKRKGILRGILKR